MANEWKKPLEWENQGSEPSSTLKKEGFKAGYKPPADLLNYFLHMVYQCITELQEYGDNHNHTLDNLLGKLSISKGGTGGNTAKTAVDNLFIRTLISADNQVNANTLKDIGVYRCYFEDTAFDPTTLNLPSRYGVMLVFGASSYITQLFVDVSAMRMYHRSTSNAGTTWETWRAVATLTDGAVPISNGGTGATNAAQARNNLGLGSVATENTVPVSKGGTGKTTALEALNELGAYSIKHSTDIPAQSDLNKYTTVGNYCCISNDTAATLSNCPVKMAFTMKVYHANGSAYYLGQEIIGHTSGVTYRRTRNGDSLTWSDWKFCVPEATTSEEGLMSAEDKKKLDGVATGAEVNQNAFSKVTVGSTTIEADNKTDTLTLEAGSNVTITPNASGDKVTFAAKDTTYSEASSSAAGLMSAADKKKLDGIAEGANKYSHPTTSGNKHIPSGGSAGAMLYWESDGAAKWGAKPSPNDIAAYGLGEGTVIAEKTDLNSLITLGNYHCTSNSIAAALVNCPTTNAFIMKVYYANGSAYYIAQEIIDMSGTVFRRNRNGGDYSWGDWVKSYTSNTVVPIADGGTGGDTAKAGLDNLLIRSLSTAENMIDANTMKDNGIYRCYFTDTTYETLNFPSKYGVMFVYGSSSYITQLFVDVSAFRMYHRATSNTGSTWGTWKAIATLTDGAVPISNGGTGATNAAQARTNLGIVTTDATTSASGLMSKSDKAKLDGMGNLFYSSHTNTNVAEMDAPLDTNAIYLVSSSNTMVADAIVCIDGDGEGKSSLFMDSTGYYQYGFGNGKVWLLYKGNDSTSITTGKNFSAPITLKFYKLMSM